MSDWRAPIGMGDAVTAARQLGLNEPRTLDQLVEVLGLSLGPAEGDRAGPRYLREYRPPGRFIAPRIDPTPAVSAASITHRPDRQADRAVVEKLPPEPPIDLQWPEAEPLPPPPVEVARVQYKPVVPDQQLRAALGMLLRRPRLSQRPDLTQLVEAVATCTPMRSIPCEVEQSLSRGATVIADLGSTMLPLLDDVEHFVDQVEQVVGSANVVVVWTDDAPGSLMEAVEVMYNSGDRPMLVISTLGAVRTPMARAGAARWWLELLDDAETRDIDAVALVPHRRAAHDVRDGRRAVAWDDLAAVGRGRG